MLVLPACVTVTGPLVRPFNDSLWDTLSEPDLVTAVSILNEAARSRESMFSKYLTGR